MWKNTGGRDGEKGEEWPGFGSGRTQQASFPIFCCFPFCDNLFKSLIDVWTILLTFCSHDKGGSKCIKLGCSWLKFITLMEIIPLKNWIWKWILIWLLPFSLCSIYWMMTIGCMPYLYCILDTFKSQNLQIFSVSTVHSSPFLSFSPFFQPFSSDACPCTVLVDLSRNIIRRDVPGSEEK